MFKYEVVTFESKTNDQSIRLKSIVTFRFVFQSIEFIDEEHRQCLNRHETNRHDLFCHAKFIQTIQRFVLILGSEIFFSIQLTELTPMKKKEKWPSYFYDAAGFSPTQTDFSNSGRQRFFDETHQPLSFNQM